MTKDEANQLILKIRDEMYYEITRFVLAHCKDTELAKDIVQEIFLEICRHVELLAVHENYRGWVYQTAKYMIMRFTAKESRIQNKAIPLEQLEDSLSFEDTYEFLALDEFSHMVTPEQLEILKDYYQNQNSISQIAKNMGKSEAACKKLLSRIRKQIKDSMAAAKSSDRSK